MEEAAICCQMLGLMRLQTQLTHSHMLLTERHFDVGEGAHSCLPHIPHQETSRDQWVRTGLALRWPLALRAWVPLGK